MDRGLLRIEGMSLSAYRKHIFDNVFPKSLFASENLDAAFILGFLLKFQSLLFTCIDGVPAIDTLCTCLAIQKPFYIKNRLLHWIMSISLRTATIMADIIVQMRVVKADEFSPSIYPLLEQWRGDSIEDPFDWWLENQSQIHYSYGQVLWDECIKLFSLYKFLRMVRTNCINYEDMQQCLGDILFHHHQEVIESQSLANADCFIFPFLSNLYCAGCVRGSVRILTVDQSRRKFILFIRKLGEFVDFVKEKPKFSHLMKRFLLLSTEEDLPFPAVLRSIVLASCIRNDLLYDYYLFDHFIEIYFDEETRSGDSEITDRLVQLFFNALRLVCHTPSRQRRILPDLLSALHRIRGTLKIIEKMSRYFGQWFVILGFGLDLYADHELAEAHWLLRELSNNAMRSFADSQLEATKWLTVRKVIPTYDNHRINRRWKSIVSLLSIEDVDRMALELSGRSPRLEYLSNRDCYEQYSRLFFASNLLD